MAPTENYYISELNMKKLVLLALVTFAGYANASLISQQVTYECPECLEAPVSFTAAEGIVDYLPYDHMAIDVEADFISLEWLVSYDGSTKDPLHINLSWDVNVFELISVVLDPDSIAYAYEFGADFLSIDISGIWPLKGDFFKAYITGAEPPPPTEPDESKDPVVSVPEPSSLILLALGIAGLLVSSKRQYR